MKIIRLLISLVGLVFGGFEFINGDLTQTIVIGALLMIISFIGIFTVIYDNSGVLK